MTDTKSCSKCGKRKPLDQFRRAQCKTCYYKWLKKYRRKNRERTREINKKSRDRPEYKAWRREYDRQYRKTERGRAVRRAANKRWEKTPRGRVYALRRGYRNRRRYRRTSINPNRYR